MQICFTPHTKQMPINYITNAHLKIRNISKDITIDHVDVVAVSKFLELFFILRDGKIRSAIFLDVFLQQPTSVLVHNGEQKDEVFVDVLVFPVYECSLFAND